MWECPSLWEAGTEHLKITHSPEHTYPHSIVLRPRRSGEPQSGNRKGADLEVWARSPITLHGIKTGSAAETPGKLCELTGSWPQCGPAKSEPRGVGKRACVCSISSPRILTPHVSNLSLELCHWCAVPRKWSMFLFKATGSPPRMDAEPRT